MLNLPFLLISFLFITQILIEHSCSEMTKLSFYFANNVVAVMTCSWDKSHSLSLVLSYVLVVWHAFSNFSINFASSATRIFENLEHEYCRFVYWVFIELWITLNWYLNEWDMLEMLQPRKFVQQVTTCCFFPQVVNLLLQSVKSLSKYKNKLILFGFNILAPQWGAQM